MATRDELMSAIAQGVCAGFAEGGWPHAELRIGAPSKTDDGGMLVKVEAKSLNGYCDGETTVGLGPDLDQPNKARFAGESAGGRLRGAVSKPKPAPKRSDWAFPAGEPMYIGLKDD